MVAVTLHQLTPLRQEVATCHLVVDVDTPACTLSPCEIAQFICPVIVAFFEAFLVKARTIKSYRLRHLYVLFQRRVCRGSPDAIRIIALVEHKALIIRLVVKIEISVLQMHLTHSCIRNHLINHLTSLHNLIFQTVEERRLRTPQLHVLNRKHRHRVVTTRHRGLCHHLIAVI